jgi:fermentation-respiration switch protein FrsA (DUF1100 family)
MQRRWFRFVAGRLVLYLAVAYLTIGLYFYFEQAKFLFPAPKDFDKVTPAAAGLAFDDLRIPVGAKGYLHGWHIPSQTGAQGMILVFHGNGYVLDSVGEEEAVDLHRIGPGLLLVDYRGYGLSTAVVPNEATIQEDADASLRYLVSDLAIAPERVFVMGRSIGSGPATYLAARTPGLGGLVLATPFTSIADAAAESLYFRLYPIDLMLHTHFDNLSRIASVHAPVLIVGGTSDTLTPPWMARRIFARANDPKQIYFVPGAGHNNLLTVGGRELVQVLQRFTGMKN